MYILIKEAMFENIMKHDEIQSKYFLWVADLYYAAVILWKILFQFDYLWYIKCHILFGFSCNSSISAVGQIKSNSESVKSVF